MLLIHVHDLGNTRATSLLGPFWLWHLWFQWDWWSHRAGAWGEEKWRGKLLHRENVNGKCLWKPIVLIFPFWEPQDSGLERLGSLLVSQRFAKAVHILISTSPQKKHSPTSIPIPDLNTPEKKCNVYMLPCLSAAVSHGCLGQERTKEDLPSPQNQIKPRPLLQPPGRILSVPPVRPQFSVAMPPSCGRERNSTWRREQMPGPGRNSPPRPQKGEESKGTRNTARVTLFVFSYCFTFPFYLPSQPSCVACPLLIT